MDLSHTPLSLIILFRRDHYRDRPRYPRDDNLQKIPRLSKNKRPTPSGSSSGPPQTKDTDGERTSNDQKQSRPLDLAPVNFPPLPSEAVSPNSSTPTQLTDTSDSKNVSNLADIVKGRKLKETAPPLTTTNHPPLPSANTINHPVPEVSTASSTSDSNQITQTQETSKPVIPTTTQSGVRSLPTSIAPTQAQPPSVAAVVASNIPPTPRTSSQSTPVSTVVSSVSTSVTTAASVVASGGQSTTTSTVSSGAGNSSSGGRSYQSKGSRGDSKGPYREKGYYGGKQGGARQTTDRDNTQNRQNGTRNSQVSKDGRQASNNRRNRDRDRDRKNGSGYRNGSSRPSPKPLKKHHHLPQAPPPPPTPTNEPKDSASTKPGIDNKNEESKPQNSGGKSEKLSYAQMAQRKKAPTSPVPPQTAIKQEPQTEDTEAPTKSLSAPASPKVERKNKTSVASGGQQLKKNNSAEGTLPVPPKSTVSKSAPTSPSKEAGASGGPLSLQGPKDD